MEVDVVAFRMSMGIAANVIERASITLIDGIVGVVYNPASFPLNATVND
jgi:hypothetical protein